jgi:glucosamine-6-phosphate deaminase
MILFGVFTATSNNAYAQSKDINDVKAIQKIITIQRNKGAKVSAKLDNKKQYKWSKKTGRLREINWYKKGDIDFSQTKTVNLDEYKGLEGTHEQSYRFFMNENLFDRINIDKKNTYLPNGMAEDEEAECERYNGIIEKLGGIDMQLLGIGLNGHIGFNEPGESFEKMTHCVELTQSTKDANQRLFKLGEKVPEKAFTMGIKSIMQSKHILLIASGANKAEIVKEAFFGPVTPKVPASILQLHNHVTVIVDKDAAKYIQ